MGSIRTKGKATREVEFDYMIISVAFNSRDRRSKDAIRKVIEECEHFLSELEKCGIDISKISGDDNRVSSYSHYNNEKDIDAVRKLKWKAPYDLALIDTIMRLSEKSSYNVEINITPIYSQKEETYKELMKEAGLDAKQTAEMLAESLGKKVKGPGKVNASGDYDYISDEKYMEDESDGKSYGTPLASCGFGMRYTELKKPSTLISKEITIEWELED